MRGPSAQRVQVSARQRQLLRKLVRGSTTPQRLVLRAGVVLGAADGDSNEHLVKRLGVTRPMLRKWRRRWAQAESAVCAVEAEEDDRGLLSRIVEVLSDAPRSGRPSEFTPKQIIDIIAIACESPDASGRPISHWTHAEIAREAIARGVVKGISVHSVGRFLRECDLKPHQLRYWLQPRPQDWAQFDAAARLVSDLYAQALTLREQGVHLLCCDEKTGIQALERVSAIRYAIPGFVERQDAHYIRHGTRTITANFEVATGRILASTIAATRTEPDFVQHLERTLAPDPKGEWIFVVDNLNTHVSASLVRFVADRCGLKVDLGRKGVRGILRSMATRAKFLSDPDHRIRFVYTPKRASWLNQIELWFSILSRRLLRRGNFVSVQHLSDRIRAFIKYFNQTLAKPFKWTYRGRPLAV